MNVSLAVDTESKTSVIEDKVSGSVSTVLLTASVGIPAFVAV